MQNWLGTIAHNGSATPDYDRRMHAVLDRSKHHRFTHQEISVKAYWRDRLGLALSESQAK